jgi:hypothetical protein
MFDLTTALDWIEKHPQTIEILEWSGFLVVAWLSGLVGFLRSRTRKPRVSISEITRRCLVEEFAEIDGGYRNAVRASFLLEVEVMTRLRRSRIHEEHEARPPRSA